ncbi:arginase family protein [Actinorugispora endophytica]|uniref:Arginase n=1 Tax=Actinorugispora endophytica TaxID=1605990 RepID=A0A4R6UTW6_9ACTN|nr:arginase family protein [Actinorugispora endophytica]TDQ50700.1 arginase [Actinorugispora endophytica]
MVWQRDVDLVVPLWQGGDDVRVAAGAAELAQLVPASGSRLHVAVPDGRRGVVDGVCNLELVSQALRQMRSRLARRDPSRILTLGGDCASDLAAVEHLGRRHRDMVVYWVDAHPDLNTPESSPSGRVHGMALRLLLGQGHPALLGQGRIAPRRVVLAGAREFDPQEAAFAEASGIALVDPVRVIADPGGVVARCAPGTPAYVHLDMDVCDPMELAAVACPAPLGPPVSSVAAALAAIAAHHDVVGVGVCEYTPVVEHDADAVRALLGALGLTSPARSAPA